MTEAEALEMIKEALNTVTPGIGDDVTAASDLKKDEILDSLDLMNFMFELEHLNGGSIEEITETFDDYRVATLIGFMTKSS